MSCMSLKKKLSLDVNHPVGFCFKTEKNPSKSFDVYPQTIDFCEFCDDVKSFCCVHINRIVNHMEFLNKEFELLFPPQKNLSHQKLL